MTNSISIRTTDGTELSLNMPSMQIEKSWSVTGPIMKESYPYAQMGGGEWPDGETITDEHLKLLAAAFDIIADILPMRGREFYDWVLAQHDWGFHDAIPFANSVWEKYPETMFDELTHDEIEKLSSILHSHRVTHEAEVIARQMKGARRKGRKAA